MVSNMNLNDYLAINQEERPRFFFGMGFKLGVLFVSTGSSPCIQISDPWDSYDFVSGFGAALKQANTPKGWLI